MQDETWTYIQVRFIYKRDRDLRANQLNQIVLLIQSGATVDSKKGRRNEENLRNICLENKTLD